MADIRLGVTGDASGGVSAMSDMSGAVGKSVVVWAEMANAVKDAGKMVVDFLVDSTKKYAESERVLRQLQRAAGDYAGAIDEQSQALSKLYAVDDDLINQSATLLTQWGGVGAATKDVERAALDLAAAMGTDLRTATTDLIRNVESGGTGLAKMGIHFKATGDKGHDLAAAVAAINAKLGGSAAADADSLIGRTHAAQLAFEDLQKSIGGMLSAALDKSGALGFITDKLRTMTTGAETLARAFERLPGFLSEVVKGKGQANAALIGLANEAIGGLLHPDAAAAALPGVTGTTNKGLKDAVKGKSQSELDDASLENAKKLQRGLDEIDEHADERAKGETDRVWKVAEEEQKARETAAAGVLATDKKLAKNEDDARLKAEDDAAALEEKALKDQQDRVAKKEKEARAAGDAIGAAMVNALADQLSKLAEGGEFDAALFVGDIMAAAVGVAGGIIGTALGAPAVGAAVGNLAAMGIRAGASAISRGNHSQHRANSYHDGGWVGAPRFHDGTWIAPDEQRAILQRDERVLSRREVANAGGPAAVDRMAKGGGPSVQVVIHAIDSQSAADSFRTKLGDGLRQALRSGQGAMPALLGVGPR